MTPLTLQVQNARPIESIPKDLPEFNLFNASIPDVLRVTVCTWTVNSAIAWG